MSLHSRELPEWLRVKLANPPEAGTGIHRWLFNCAALLARWRDAGETESLLWAAAGKCSRRVTSKEMRDAIQNGRAKAVNEPPLPRGLRSMLSSPGMISRPGSPPWPAADWSAIARVALKGTGLEDLKRASPAPVDGVPASVWLKRLFPGDPLLCIAKAKPSDARTRPLSRWTARPEELQSHAFIVPSPMSAPSGLTQDGRRSHRCLDNTGPREWLVAEFDFAKPAPGEPRTQSGDILDELSEERPPRDSRDLCAALLLHLKARGAPLALAVHSGGKSIHGWFPAHGADDQALRPFFAEARTLGADSATWNRCQLVRLPGGARNDGRPQPVLFFDPACLPETAGTISTQ